MAAANTNLRVMVDANVLVAGLGWPRWAYAVLQHAVMGDFQLVLSPFVIAEAHRHLQRIAPSTLPDFQTFLELSRYEMLNDPTPAMLLANAGLVRDSKDIPVALAALNGNVDCLISNDRDLTESIQLQQQLPVLLPAIFLREYMGWTSAELETIRHRNWRDLG